MGKVSDANVTKLYRAYKEVYELCDMLQIDGIKGSVRIEATKAKKALYIAWQQGLTRLQEAQ